MREGWEETSFSPLFPFLFPSSLPLGFFIFGSSFSHFFSPPPSRLCLHCLLLRLPPCFSCHRDVRTTDLPSSSRPPSWKGNPPRRASLPAPPYTTSLLYPKRKDSRMEEEEEVLFPSKEVLFFPRAKRRKALSLVPKTSIHEIK